MNLLGILIYGQNVRTTKYLHTKQAFQDDQKEHTWRPNREGRERKVAREGIPPEVKRSEALSVMRRNGGRETCRSHGSRRSKGSHCCKNALASHFPFSLSLSLFCFYIAHKQGLLFFGLFFSFHESLPLQVHQNMC